MCVGGEECVHGRVGVCAGEGEECVHVCMGVCAGEGKERVHVCMGERGNGEGMAH